MHKVFVYGTLRRGHGNHILLRQAHFLGEWISKDSDYFMCGRGVPFLSLKPGHQGARVLGEMYEVTDEQLERLDQLEGHPAWYCRKEHAFVPHGGPSEAVFTAWVYLVPHGEMNPANLVEPDAQGVLDFPRPG